MAYQSLSDLLGWIMVVAWVGLGEEGEEVVAPRHHQWEEDEEGKIIVALLLQAECHLRKSTERERERGLARCGTSRYPCPLLTSSV